MKRRKNIITTLTTNWFSAWIFKSTNSGKSSQAKRNAHRHIYNMAERILIFIVVVVGVSCMLLLLFFRSPFPSKNAHSFFLFFSFHSIFRSLSIFADILSGPTTKTRDSQVKTFHPCITYTYAGWLLCAVMRFLILLPIIFIDHIHTRVYRIRATTKKTKTIEMLWKL